MIEAPVIILIGMSNVFGQQYLLPTKQTRAYTLSVTIGAVVNIVCNIPLIVLMGVKGAMIATLISEGCVTLYQLFITRNQLALKPAFYGFVKYLIAGLIMFTLVFFLNQTMPISLKSLFFQIIIGGIVYLLLIVLLQPPIWHNLKRIRNNRQ